METITPVPALGINGTTLNIFGMWTQISIPPPKYSVNIQISTKPNHTQIFN